MIFDPTNPRGQDRMQLRAAIRARRKLRMKLIQKLMGIPKAFVQHARRHGQDAETIALEYRKHGARMKQLDGAL